jgi:hypothetical protein
MDRHRHPGGVDRPGRGQQVQDVPVHPAVRHHPHQMRRPARGPQAVDEGLQRRVGGKAAVLDRQVDRAQIHRHHPARADVGVADLGIAHLPAGQARIRAVGDQRGMGAAGPEPVEGGHIRLRRGAGFRALAQPPAIKDAQDDRLEGGHRGAFPWTAPF